MLAKVYKGECIPDYYTSEKLDGMRCLWDSGFTRKVPKAELSWANHDGDGRYVTKPIATGLWSRYGNVIHAPDWWLDLLPSIPLDGELYSDTLSRQELMKVVKTITPDADAWKQVQYYIFDSPPLDIVFQDGVINNPNYKKTFCGVKYPQDARLNVHRRFHETVDFLLHQIGDTEVLTVHNQHEFRSYEQMHRFYNLVLDRGGEGLVLRYKYSWWVPQRSRYALKLKPDHDDEGVIVGFVAGKDELAGKLGSVTVNWKDKFFNLSGFTHAERELDDPNWALNHEGEVLDLDYTRPLYFKLGEQITFKYRALSDSGIPIEARYFRKRED